MKAAITVLALLMAVQVHAGQKKSATTTCPQSYFPATGQLTSYQTGDDGWYKTGAALRYQDNQDGTITDSNTGLIWEKQGADGSIHNAPYLPWVASNLFGSYTIWDWLAALNTSQFAGHDDWRVPNVKELQSLVDFEYGSPAIHLAFNTNCVGGVSVLSGSCTWATLYWTSTTITGGSGAWMVDFSSGQLYGAGKDYGGMVRAVRGGCTH